MSFIRDRLAEPKYKRVKTDFANEVKLIFKCTSDLFTLEKHQKNNNQP
jgi:hypothetical protein